MKRLVILFSLFINVFSFSLFSQDFPTDWNVEGGALVDSSNTIKKTANTAAWGDAGGHSESSLEISDAGYIKYIISDIDQQKALGFSISTSDNKFTSLLFGVYFNSGSAFEITDGKQGKKIDGISNLDTLIFYYNNGSYSCVKNSTEQILSYSSTPASALKAKACLKSQNSSFTDVRISFLNLENAFEINAIDLPSDYQLTFTYNSKLYQFTGGKTCIFPISKSCGQKDIKVTVENDTTVNELNIKVNDNVDFQDVYFSANDSYYFEDVKYSYSFRRVFLFQDKNSSENQVEFRLGLNLENGILFNPNTTALKVNGIEGLQGAYTFKVIDQEGNVVFSTNDPNKHWDGKNTSGNLVDVDTYNYEVNIDDIYLSGTFLLQY